MGGLVGNGFNVTITSSSVVVGGVSGSGSRVGGLVGSGDLARIYSSSVVADEVVSGASQVGGLVGYGPSARIVSSSVVVDEVVSGAGFVGGLVGLINSDNFIQIAYSYVVSGSSVNMLVGFGSGPGVASYWDSETSGVSSGSFGAPQTTSELRSPTGYDGIYAAWDDETDIFVSGEDEPLAVWCDRDNSGSIEAGEKIDANLIWDFGESDEYPAIRCTPLKPDEWRNWWFLNATDQPQLNQMRLDEVLNQ